MTANPDGMRLLALADEYEAGLRKMELSGYEEFDVARKNHQLVIDALRAQAAAPRAHSSAAMDDMRDPEVASAMREEAALIPAAAPVPQRDAEPVAWVPEDYHRWLTPHNKPAQAAMMWKEKSANNAYTTPLYAAPSRLDARLQRLSYDAQTFHRMEAKKALPALPAGEEVRRPLCSCKASQRDGQHMMWCPALSPSSNGKPATEKSDG